MAQNDRSAITTFENKLYQLLIAGLDGDRIEEAPYCERILDLARKGIGGFVISGGMKETLMPFVGKIRSCAPAPLFFASHMDRAVGGKVRGLTPFPSPMAFAAAMRSSGGLNRGIAERALFLMASEAVECGINMPIISAPDGACGDAARAAVTEALSYYHNTCRAMGLCVFEKRPPCSGSAPCAYHTAADVQDKDCEPHELTVAILGDEPGRTAAQCINMGADMLIDSGDPDATVSGLAAALLDGEFTEERIDSAIAGIALLKSRLSLPGAIPADYAQREELSAKVAQAAITLVKGRGRFFPIREPDSIPLIYAGDQMYFETSPLRYYVKQASHVSSPLPSHERPVMFLLFPPKDSGNRSSGSMEPDETEALMRLIRASSPAIIVSFGSPYALEQFKDAAVLIAAYDASGDAQEAVFKCIMGESPFEGEFPLDFGVSGRLRPRGPRAS